jgi:hypothetical protein
MLTLAVPAAAGLTARPIPPLRTVRLAAPIPSRGGGRMTRLVLVRLDEDGHAHPIEQPDSARGDSTQVDATRRDSAGRDSAQMDSAGWDSAQGMADHGNSAALHGMVGAAGFAVLGPGRDAAAGDRLPLLALPVAEF